MSRIQHFRPNDLDEQQRRLYTAIVGGRRAGAGALVPVTDEEGRLAGPFNAMLLHPELGMALQELGTAIRYRGALSPRSRELAILTVAAHWQCPFELNAHTIMGAQAGLTDAELEAICVGDPLRLPDAEEDAVLTATRTLMHSGDLSSAQYAAAVSTLGPDKLFEISTLVGYYSLLALQMRIFDVSRPPEPGTACNGTEKNAGSSD